LEAGGGEPWRRARRPARRRRCGSAGRPRSLGRGSRLGPGDPSSCPGISSRRRCR
jgi:hypothetical protein